MVLLGLVTERVVLRPLVNQPQITLFMATIGLTFVLEGLSQLVWGSQPHGLELGIPDVPMEWLSQKWNINISQFDLFAAVIAGLLVAVLAVFFQKTRIGRALRAVADDHQAALAVGIPLQHIWAIVWGVAGFVALVAGLMWGVRNGVQFALDLRRAEGAAGAADRRLRVDPRRDHRRPDHRRHREAGRGLLRARWSAAASSPGSPTWWRCSSCWFGPEGLFGEKHIDRV